jgi:predicted DNA-binding ribbon-helix-helix protein
MSLKRYSIRVESERAGLQTTSISLEPEFWSALMTFLPTTNSITDLFAEVKAWQRATPGIRKNNFSSACRLWVLMKMQEKLS